MKKNLKKLTLNLFVTAVLVISSAAMAFATEVPAKLTIPTDAIVKVDITVGYEDPETGSVDVNGILMRGSKGTPNLTVQNLTVKNNATMGRIVVETVEAAGVADGNGDTWTIVADTTDFANLNVDSHKVSLKAENKHDMTSAYKPELEVRATEKESISFSGKTGPVSKAYDSMQVAKMIVTVYVA